MAGDAFDEQTLVLLRRGGGDFDEGLSRLFKSYAPEFRRFFVFHGMSRSDADDLVQETFLKITRSINSYRGDSRLSSWIWTIARNALNDHCRCRKSHAEVYLDEDGWELIMHNSEQLRVDHDTQERRELNDCVRGQFAVFASKYPSRAHLLSLKMRGHSLAFIADVVQRTPGATREVLSQTRKIIRSFLAPCKDMLSN